MAAVTIFLLDGWPILGRGLLVVPWHIKAKDNHGLDLRLTTRVKKSLWVNLHCWRGDCCRMKPSTQPLILPVPASSLQTPRSPADASPHCKSGAQLTTGSAPKSGKDDTVPHSDITVAWPAVYPVPSHPLACATPRGYSTYSLALTVKIVLWWAMTQLSAYCRHSELWKCTEILKYLA